MRTRKITVEVESGRGDDRLTRLELEEAALLGALREVRRKIVAEVHRIDGVAPVKAFKQECRA